MASGRDKSETGRRFFAVLEVAQHHCPLCPSLFLYAMLKRISYSRLERALYEGLRDDMYITPLYHSPGCPPTLEHPAVSDGNPL